MPTLSMCVRLMFACNKSSIPRQAGRKVNVHEGWCSCQARPAEFFLGHCLIDRKTYLGTWLGNCNGVCGSNHADGAVGRSDKQRIATTFRTGEVPENVPLPPDYNIAPTTFQPVIRASRESGDRELVLMEKRATGE